MPTDMTVQKNADADFFHRVKQQPALTDTLNRLGFNDPWIYSSIGNAGIGVSKNKWTFAVPDANYALNIHFEARRRTEYRIEIGPEPYISNIAKKPELLSRLAPLVARRAQIIDSLRHQLIASGRVPGDIQVSKAHQLRSTSVAAHTIVTFQAAMPSDPTPAQTASFFSRVIEIVTPIVDEYLNETLP